MNSARSSIKPSVVSKLKFNSYGSVELNERLKRHFDSFSRNDYNSRVKTASVYFVMDSERSTHFQSTHDRRLINVKRKKHDTVTAFDCESK